MQMWPSSGIPYYLKHFLASGSHSGPHGSDVRCSDLDRIFRFQEGWQRWVWNATFLIFQAFSCTRHWVSSASFNTRFLVSCFGFGYFLVFYLVGSLVLLKIPNTGGSLCWFSSDYSSSPSPAWLDLFGTALGFSVGHNTSHRRQGISTMEGFSLTNWIIFRNGRAFRPRTGWNNLQGHTNTKSRKDWRIW